ncbi:OmpA family protein [Fibrella forsythiae]|uniref:OmpA family protein n=1 Tax=Fibrella forsythiae TaxID=2817061 RepID=A0ABS3JIJ9_9BACT|nr:OmpA family protein [Fibrella forsythiae]MBO0949064.1 OmpA family protein [Fibrella forsythiae]
MFTNKTPWIILLLLWMGGSTWWHVCKIKQLCLEKPLTVAVPGADVSMPALTITDADRLNLNVPGNFSYAKSGATANAAAVGNTLQTLADYLKANPTRTLGIDGYYRADEQNPSTYPNLGVARAEDIKAQLVKMGVPATQLTTNGILVSEATASTMPYNAKGDSLYGGLAFAFTGVTTEPAPVSDTMAKVVPMPKTEEALADAQKYTSVFKPIDLYFKLSESSYIQTKDTKKFFEEAAKYLKENKDKKLLLTGHTDNAGPDAVNMELSKARAATVKSRLRKGGIAADQIMVEAKGETQPKESNETLEGRKANRRVTVVVQ